MHQASTEILTCIPHYGMHIKPETSAESLSLPNLKIKKIPTSAPSAPNNNLLSVGTLVELFQLPMQSDFLAGSTCIPYYAMHIDPA